MDVIVALTPSILETGICMTLIAPPTLTDHSRRSAMTFSRFGLLAAWTEFASHLVTYRPCPTKQSQALTLTYIEPLRGPGLG